MNYTDYTKGQTDEEYILVCDVSDDALEAAADNERQTGQNITWLYCPTGLTICRA